MIAAGILLGHCKEMQKNYSGGFEMPWGFETPEEAGVLGPVSWGCCIGCVVGIPFD